MHAHPDDPHEPNRSFAYMCDRGHSSRRLLRHSLAYCMDFPKAKYLDTRDVAVKVLEVHRNLKVLLEMAQNRTLQREKHVVRDLEYGVHA